MIKNDSNIELKKNLVVSYLTLRRVIGLLGMAFPFILIIGSVIIHGCNEIENSISLYYQTGMRDQVVGILCAIGLFLFMYRGHEKDYIACRIAGFCAIGIAFFPTNPPNQYEITNCTVNVIAPNFVYTMHFVFGIVFFLTLAYISYFLFTKTAKNVTPTKQKLKRNLIFRTAGIVIILCLVVIAVYFVFKDKHTQLYQYNIVLWAETVMLLAFGFSWITKGEMIYKDVKKV